MAIITPVFSYFTDAAGEQLENGYIYIGTVNLNPKTDPITAYWDDALTIPAAQPIRTVGGYPSRSGKAAELFVSVSYSITVEDSSNTLVFSRQDVNSLDGSSPDQILNDLGFSTFFQTLIGDETAEELRRDIGVWDDLGSSGGTADTYTATPTTALAAYVSGYRFTLKIQDTNITTSTLNISALGEKTIKKYDGAGTKVNLDPGDMQQDQVYDFHYDGTDSVLLNPERSNINVAFPRNYLSGLDISIGTDTDHDIDVAVGECRDFDNTKNIRLTTTITKQIDANWAEGDNAGGFPSGLTLAIDTWYHFFVILKSDGTVDAGFDTSLTAANLLTDATGYTEFRRLASVQTDGSSNLIGFFHDGDRFYWNTPILAFSGSSPTTPVLLTVDTPLGIKTRVFGGASSSVSASFSNFTMYYVVNSADTGGLSSGSSNMTFLYVGINSIEDDSGSGQFEVLTNTSSQVYHDSTYVQNTNTFVEGWVDRRVS